jgi:hypothetical protein
MERTGTLTLPLSAGTQQSTKIACRNVLKRDSNPVALTRSFTEMDELWGMVLIVCTLSMEYFSEDDSCLGSQEMLLVRNPMVH